MTSIEFCRQQAEKIPYVKGNERVFSCVVNKKGKLLSAYPNSFVKTHPLQRKYSVKNGFSPQRCYLHSEVRSIVSAAKFNQKNCKIIIARINRCGKLLDSWPCPSCMSLIKDVGFISAIECGIEER